SVVLDVTAAPVFSSLSLHDALPICEDLAIDIAIFGDPDAEKTLFLVSGTHGQEGFYGSALQIEFLRDLEIPEGVNVIALHALNPDRKSTRLNSSHRTISYAVFCSKK